MTSYVTSRDGQKITARKIRDHLKAIPLPEEKIGLALRLLADAFRYGNLDVFRTSNGARYAAYAVQTLGLYSRYAGIEASGIRYYIRKSKAFADSLLQVADCALDD